MSMLQFGKKSCVFVGLIYLVLVLSFDSSDSTLEVKDNPKLGLPSPVITVDHIKNSTDKNGVPNAGSAKKDTEKVEKSEEIIQKFPEKNNLSQTVSVGDEHSHEKIDDVKSKGKMEDNVEETKEENETGSVSTNSKTVKDEGAKELKAGECDSSNMCVDEKNDLVACLQVPGNDSPDLLLLIKNIGKQPLIVGIAAPENVQLEKTKVQLQAKEDKKVKVSIGFDGIGSLINLTTNEGRCTLDFKDLIPRDPKGETQYAYKPNYLAKLTRTHYLLLFSITILFFLASFWMCFGFSRKLFLKNGYQEVEMELPVSLPGQPKTDSPVDSWDNNWDDEWVDEEAPKTPTLPVTPNLSLRGLASRRLSKEGWKD
ncbi:hypothetical protein V2J09_004858 [Rumex salicifolius]